MAQRSATPNKRQNSNFQLERGPLLLPQICRVVYLVFFTTTADFWVLNAVMKAFQLT